MLLHNLPLISAKEVFGHLFLFDIAELYAASLFSQTVNFLMCSVHLQKCYEPFSGLVSSSIVTVDVNLVISCKSVFIVYFHCVHKQ